MIAEPAGNLLPLIMVAPNGRANRKILPCHKENRSIRYLSIFSFFFVPSYTGIS